MILQHPRGLGAGLRHRTAAGLGVIVAGMLSVGCGLGSRELQPGAYRGVISTPEGELPFGLLVAREESGLVLHLVNGEERARAPQATVADGRLTARFDADEATVTAEIRGERLSGRVVLPAAGDQRTEYPFEAHAGRTWRFFEEPSNDNADVAGHWDVTLTSGTGEARRAVAEFRQSFERVTGTIGTTDAPGGPLAGEVRGDEVYLSRYDGNTAQLCRARIEDHGGLAGWCWSPAGGRESLEARRNPDAALETVPVDVAPATVPQAVIPPPAPTP